MVQFISKTAVYEYILASYCNICACIVFLLLIFFENKLVLFLIERIIIYFNKFNN